MIVLGGNMRLKALLESGVKDVWIDVAEGWTDEQKKEFIIKDNVGFGEWDWDILANEWEPHLLEDWGLDVPDFAVEPEFDELTEDFEKTEFSIKITFKTIEDLQKAENDIQELIDRKYKDAFFSVKGGII
jgi:hypothetical protein